MGFLYVKDQIQLVQRDKDMQVLKNETFCFVVALDVHLVQYLGKHSNVHDSASKNHGNAS